MPQMSSLAELFPRGSYQVLNSSVVAREAFAGVLGQAWEFPDVLYDTGADGPPDIRTTSTVRCRLVRNESGSPILPKQACKIDPANPGIISALTSSYLDQFALADEFLPAAGVPDDGIFWVVVRGSAKGIL